MHEQLSPFVSYLRRGSSLRFNYGRGQSETFLPSPRLLERREIAAARNGVVRSSPFVCISDCTAALRGMTSSERHSKPCRDYSLIGSEKASLRLHTTVWRVPTLVDKGFFEFKVCFFPRDIGVRISSKTPVISGFREIAYGSVVVLVIELASSSVGIPSNLNLRCISSGLSSAARMPLPGLKKCMEVAKLCGFPTPCSACTISFFFNNCKQHSYVHSLEATLRSSCLVSAGRKDDPLILEDCRTCVAMS